MGECKRKSCIYYVKNKLHGCNYLFVTGQSKLAQTPKGEKYSVENCKFYESGRARTATKSIVLDYTSPDEVLRQVSTIDGKLVEKLYNYDLCDADIAMLLRVSSKAISKIRRQKGLKRSMSKGGSIRRIDWEEVKKMFNDGYSDIAIAMYIKVPLEVIQRYKDLVARNMMEGGETVGVSKNSL